MTNNSFYMLDNTLKIKHNNLTNLSIFFQHLAIESVVHFKLFCFEIVLDVEMFSIKKSN
jgi:hypothetical protein